MTTSSRAPQLYARGLHSTSSERMLSPHGMAFEMASKRQSLSCSFCSSNSSRLYLVFLLIGADGGQNFRCRRPLAFSDILAC